MVKEKEKYRRKNESRREGRKVGKWRGRRIDG